MYKTIFRLLAAHGLRVSECLALRRDDVANGFLVARRLKGSQVTMQKLLVGITDGTRRFHSEPQRGGS
jgi:integrase